jgi:hypothetical protein
MNKKIEYGLGVALSILLPLAIFFLILNLQKKCNPEQTSNKISPSMDISNTIYKNESTNILFLQHLNLVSDINVINNILDSITAFNTFISTSPSSYNYHNLDYISMYSNPELIPYFNNIMQKILVSDTTVIGLIFNVLQNMTITYNLSTINFNTNNIMLPEAFTDISNSSTTDTIEHFYGIFDDIGDAFETAGEAIGGGFKTAFDPVGCYLSGGKAGCGDSDSAPSTIPGIIKVNLDSF